MYVECKLWIRSYVDGVCMIRRKLSEKSTEELVEMLNEMRIEIDRLKGRLDLLMDVEECVYEEWLNRSDK